MEKFRTNESREERKSVEETVMKAMKAIRKYRAGAVAIIAALIFSAVSVANAELLPGEPVGPLEVENTKGASVDLGNYGKPYVICFFVPDAAGLSGELKYLKIILGKKKFRDYEMVAITRGLNDDEKKRASDFIVRERIGAVLLFEPKSQAGKKFGVRTFPSFFIVDGKGIVRTLGVDTVSRKIRRRTFEDFLGIAKAGKEIPIIDMIPETSATNKILALIGKEAPDFALPDLNGKVYKLSDLKGKNVIVVFWSEGCPHCRQELPMINEFYKKYKSDYNFEVLAVTKGCCPAGSKRIEDFVSDKKIAYPILLDTEESISGAYKYDYVPTVFFINRNGMIVDLTIGMPRHFDAAYHSIFTDPLRLGADDKDKKKAERENSRKPSHQAELATGGGILLMGA